ncbi:MAG: type I-E CRISPR-associated protein Cse2/CasB [Burkholderiaceae bacterium]|nr:type I-E CRISPR-associated protein Cse2/CasB [Burkholderiaceae bacterium]
MSTHNPYELSTAAKTELCKWWGTIHSETASGQARADRATLRRASDLNAIACTPAYQRLYRRIVAASDSSVHWNSFQQDRIAAVVGLLAHVKEDKEKISLPEAMSREGGKDNPVSPLRFRRLLEAPDTNALFIGLRRTLPLIQGAVGVLSLADDVFGWNERVQRRWAYDYQWPDPSKN